MKYGIVNFSDLNGRWDPEFHLINQTYRDRAAVLSQTMTKENAIVLLSDAMPTDVLMLLSPLTRGNSSNPNREQLLRAVQEYPFLALAIVKDKGADLLKQKQELLSLQARSIEQTREALESAGPVTSGVQSIPPAQRSALSRGSTRFMGSVVYFDGDTFSIPVETSETAYVADCWVIPANEWTGPDMIVELANSGNVPVPRRYEDLGQPIGFVTCLPDHTVNYGRGWGPEDRG